jgi:hypothetical protein
MNIILTFVALLYHGDGSVETKPAQTIAFADRPACEEMRVTLLRRNWDNPLPIPAGTKPEDYVFSRYQVAGCVEEKPKSQNEAPAEEPKQP